MTSSRRRGYASHCAPDRSAIGADVAGAPCRVAARVSASRRSSARGSSSLQTSAATLPLLRTMQSGTVKPPTRTDRHYSTPEQPAARMDDLLTASAGAGPPARATRRRSPSINAAAIMRIASTSAAK